MVLIGRSHRLARGFTEPETDARSTPGTVDQTDPAMQFDPEIQQNSAAFPDFRTDRFRAIFRLQFHSPDKRPCIPAAGFPKNTFHRDVFPDPLISHRSVIKTHDSNLRIDCSETYFIFFFAENLDFPLIKQYISLKTGNPGSCTINRTPY